MSGIRDSADPTVTHMARTTEMLKKYPLPWRVSADKPGMSAVVAANGRAVAGSLICRVMGGSVAAERQLHALIVKASRAFLITPAAVCPRPATRSRGAARTRRPRPPYRVWSTDVLTGDVCRSVRELLKGYPQLKYSAVMVRRRQMTYGWRIIVFIQTHSPGYRRRMGGGISRDSWIGLAGRIRNHIERLGLVPPALICTGDWTEDDLVQLSADIRVQTRDFKVP